MHPLGHPQLAGQPDVSLDLLTALNEGQILLVNLSTERDQIDEEDALCSTSIKTVVT